MLPFVVTRSTRLMDEGTFWSKWSPGEVRGRRTDGLCPRCVERPRKEGDAYCVECRRQIARDWMRANRPRYAELSSEEQLKSRCRAYTNTLIARGQLERTPCEGCGGTVGLQAHHVDFTKPREVVFWCRTCRRLGRGP